jgi:hypothetical protein
MTGLSYRQRAILRLWPKWVADLRAQGYRVASRATRQKLTIPYDPDAIHMYKTRRVLEHTVVMYYKLTEKRAPQRFDQDVWR